MLNVIVISGNLVADPELRRTSNGTPVASFTVAVQRDYDKDKTDFIPCVAWRQTGEFVSKYFSKGRRITLKGSLQLRSWGEGEQKRTVAEINVESVYFADSKKTEVSEFPVLEDDSELPFV